MIRVDLPGLGVVEAGCVDSDLSSQWLSASCVLFPSLRGGPGERGMFHRYRCVRAGEKHLSFLKNNSLAQRESGVQHQNVRVKAKASLTSHPLPLLRTHLRLHTHLRLALASLLSKALALGPVTWNVLISVLLTHSCQT